jgi:NAD(P)-dependent dehydrogenase (short-subunit alcohol dehydrogenase family)
MADVGPVIVAGAGPGVGLAVARRFARDGRPVALIARRRAALDDMAARIAAEGGRAQGFVADIADLAALDAALDAAVTAFGAPGVLVWNGGRWVETPALALAPAAFEAELRLCVVGALAAAQRAAAAMTGGGTILFTGGGLALAPQFGGAVPALTAGKAALRALTLAAHAEFAARGIHLATVTIAGVVAPGGPFDPDRIAEAFRALDAEPRGSWTAERVFDGR